MIRPLILAALVCATPAAAQPLSDRLRDLPAEEYVWQGMHAADMALTADCIGRNTCRELNPLLGHHPSTGKMIGFGIGMSILHAAVTSELQDRAPRLVRPWLIVTIAGKGLCLGLHVKRRF